MGWCRELVKPGRFDMWPFRIHKQLYPTHVPTASPNVGLSTHPDQFSVVPHSDVQAQLGLKATAMARL